MHKGDFIVDAKVLIAGPELRLVGESPRISVLNGLKIESGGASVLLKPGEELSFSKPTKLTGVSELTAGKVETKALKVTGGAEFCGGAATLSKQGLKLDGGLSVGGLAFKKVSETLTLNGVTTRTKLELPAGIRIEAVLVKVLESVQGARFLQIGDAADPSRFAISTDLRSGSLIRGLDHWGQGRAVQKVKGPVVITGDAAASGKIQVTVHYVDPAAL